MYYTHVNVFSIMSSKTELLNLERSQPTKAWMLKTRKTHTIQHAINRIPQSVTQPTNIVTNDEYIVVDCPHCRQPIQIYKKEFNCRIFRHGVYKHNNVQIPPHTKKEICDKLANEELIYGCGKPFRIVDNKNIEKCDYI